MIYALVVMVLSCVVAAEDRAWRPFAILVTVTVLMVAGWAKLRGWMP